MIESHLQAGAQKVDMKAVDRPPLVYGQSITDACIGWEESLGVLATLAAAVAARRNLNA